MGAPAQAYQHPWESSIVPYTQHVKHVPQNSGIVACIGTLKRLPLQHPPAWIWQWPCTVQGVCLKQSTACRRPSPLTTAEESAALRGSCHSCRLKHCTADGGCASYGDILADLLCTCRLPGVCALRALPSARQQTPGGVCPGVRAGRSTSSPAPPRPARHRSVKHRSKGGSSQWLACICNCRISQWPISKL